MEKIVGKKIKNYPEKTYSHAATAIDVVLFRFHNNELQVLLIKLKEEPFTNMWGLPGGLVTHRESLEKAAARHLKNKIGLKKKIYLEQLYTFGNPKRDPFGWIISVAYLGLTSQSELQLKIASRYSNYKWFSIAEVPSDLAYDHEDIVKLAVARLTAKMSYTNIIGFLMKDNFTLTELQNIYESITNRVLDKRNFRKRVLSLGIIRRLNRFRKEGAQRPARLYSFANKELIETSIL